MHDVAYPTPRTAGADPLFSMRSLGYAYPNGQVALADINLDIFPGDRVALVGQNGAGKTTLAKHLVGLLPLQRGRLLYRGRAAPEAFGGRANLEVGLLFQDPDDQLFCNTLYDDVAFGPFNQGRERDGVDRAVHDALGAVHLDHLVYKTPHHLSYGQKKRAALATLLSMEPPVLILDEPTANLDPRQEELLVELLERFSGTLICISHDLPFLYALCQRAVVLDHGRIHHDYSLKELVSHTPSLREHGLDFSFRFSCCGGTHHHGAGPHHHGQEPRSGEDAGSEGQAMSDGDANGGPGALIRLENVGFTYGDGTRALEGISLEIRRGERLAIVGENGAGKSTLLACLTGMRRAQTGRYFFDGTLVDKKVASRLWRHMGIVFQDSLDQLFCPSCFDEVAFGPRQMGLPAGEVEARVQEVLRLVRLEGYEDRVPIYLSGGERRRLAIASVLSMEPEVLILDEPTAGLDPRSQEMLLEILRDLEVTMILVSHDMFFIAELSRRSLVMHEGRIIRDCATDDFLNDKALTSLNQLHYTFRNRCAMEIQQLQEQRRAASYP